MMIIIIIINIVLQQILNLCAYAVVSKWKVCNCNVLFSNNTSQ